MRERIGKQKSQADHKYDGTSFVEEAAADQRFPLFIPEQRPQALAGRRRRNGRSGLERWRPKRGTGESLAARNNRKRGLRSRWQGRRRISETPHALFQPGHVRRRREVRPQQGLDPPLGLGESATERETPRGQNTARQEQEPFHRANYGTRRANIGRAPCAGTKGLKRILHRQLDDARIERRRDLSESRGPEGGADPRAPRSVASRPRGLRDARAEAVRHIERIGAELERVAFPEPELLRQRHIDLEESRTLDIVPPRGRECTQRRSGEGCRI